MVVRKCRDILTNFIGFILGAGFIWLYAISQIPYKLAPLVGIVETIIVNGVVYHVVKVR